MSEPTVSVEFVTEESKASGDIAVIENGGGKIDSPAKPWDIPVELTEDYGDAQFEPLTIIAATMATGFLIKRISDVWLDHTRPGGHVIDTRGGKIVVRVAPYLKRGTLVLQSEKNVRVLQPQERDEVLPLLSKFIDHG